MEQKNNVGMILFAIILIFLTGIGGYFLGQSQKIKSENSEISYPVKDDADSLMDYITDLFTRAENEKYRTIKAFRFFPGAETNYIVATLIEEKLNYTDYAQCGFSPLENRGVSFFNPCIFLGKFLGQSPVMIVTWPSADIQVQYPDSFSDYGANVFIPESLTRLKFIPGTVNENGDKEILVFKSRQYEPCSVREQDWLLNVKTKEIVLQKSGEWQAEICD